MRPWLARISTGLPGDGGAFHVKTPEGGVWYASYRRSGRMGGWFGRGGSSGSDDSGGDIVQINDVHFEDGLHS